MEKNTTQSLEFKKEKNYTSLKVLYIIIWIIFGFSVLIASLFGVYNTYYSKIIVNLFLIITGLCFVLPFILIPINKKYMKYKLHIIYIIIYSVLIVSITTFFIMNRVAKNYFNDFTEEKWIEYPQYRKRMLDDLIENHRILDMDKQEVTSLLGVPDGESDTKFTYYIDRKNRVFEYIEIEFENGKVIGARYYNVS